MSAATSASVPPSIVRPVRASTAPATAEHPVAAVSAAHAWAVLPHRGSPAPPSGRSVSNSRNSAEARRVRAQRPPVCDPSAAAVAAASFRSASSSRINVTISRPVRRAPSRISVPVSSARTASAPRARPMPSVRATSASAASAQSSRTANHAVPPLNVAVIFAATTSVHRATSIMIVPRGISAPAAAAFRFRSWATASSKPEKNVTTATR